MFKLKICAINEHDIYYYYIEAVQIEIISNKQNNQDKWFIIHVNEKFKDFCIEYNTKINWITVDYDQSYHNISKIDLKVSND